MLNQAQIDEICREIKTGFDPEKIVLFGPHAFGKAGKKSDVDLLVVTPTDIPEPKRFAAVSRLLKGFPAKFNLLVRTPEEYARQRQAVTHIVYFADKYGKVIYQK